MQEKLSAREIVKRLGEVSPTEHAVTVKLSGAIVSCIARYRWNTTTKTGRVGKQEPLATTVERLLLVADEAIRELENDADATHQPAGGDTSKEGK